MGGFAGVPVQLLVRFLFCFAPPATRVYSEEGDAVEKPEDSAATAVSTTDSRGVCFFMGTTVRRRERTNINLYYFDDMFGTVGL